jgi:TP901 family phage tail tape measure protein
MGVTDTVGLTARLKFEGDSAIDGMTKVSGVFGNMRTKMEGAKAGFAQVKSGISGLGIGGILAAAGIGGAIKKYAEFDSIMSQVRANLGEESRKDFPMLENAARSMAAKTGKSVTTVADAMATLSLETADTTETMDMLKPVLTGMIAAGTDAATTAKILDITLDKFGLTSKDAAGTMDVLVQASRLGTASMPEFGTALASLGGTANLLKIPMADTAAALALFTKGGLDAGTASMNLNIGLMRLAKASKDGWINIKGLGKIQVATKNGALDLETTLANVSVALKSVSDPAQRVRLAMELFGMRGRESATAMERLTANPNRLSDMFRKIKSESDGAAESMEKLKTDNVAHKFKELKYVLGNVAMEIGAAFIPFVNQGVKALVPFVQQFGTAVRFFSEAPGAINLTNVAIKGVSPTIVAVAQGLAAGFKSVKEAIASVSKAVGFLGGMFGGDSSGNAGIKTAVKWAVQLGAVAGAYKLLGPAIKSTLNIGIGSAKILKGALGTLGAGMGGVIGVLSKRFPMLSKLLPKSTGALGKIVSSAEKIAAQPVRIVNWDEAGMGGGIGGGAGGGTMPSGAREIDLGGGPAPQAPGKSPWYKGGRLAPGFKGQYGSGLAIAAGGGLAANLLIQGELRAPVKTLANTILATSAMFGPAGQALGGVAAAGMALGSKIDEWTNASGYIASAFWKLTEITMASANKMAQEMYSKNVGYKNMQNQAAQFLKMAEGGVTSVQTTPGGAREKLSAELLQNKLSAYGKKVGMNEAETKAMVTAIMNQMGPKLADAIRGVKLEANLTMESRPVAKSVAVSNQESRERRGEKQEVGARRKAAS